MTSTEYCVTIRRELWRYVDGVDADGEPTFDDVITRWRPTEVAVYAAGGASSTHGITLALHATYARACAVNIHPNIVGWAVAVSWVPIAVDDGRKPRYAIVAAAPGKRFKHGDVFAIHDGFADDNRMLRAAATKLLKGAR
jgi:hypothetical protein